MARDPRTIRRLFTDATNAGLEIDPSLGQRVESIQHEVLIDISNLLVQQDIAQQLERLNENLETCTRNIVSALDRRPQGRSGTGGPL